MALNRENQAAFDPRKVRVPGLDSQARRGGDIRDRTALTGADLEKNTAAGGEESGGRGDQRPIGVESVSARGKRCAWIIEPHIGREIG